MKTILLCVIAAFSLAAGETPDRNYTTRPIPVSRVDPKYTEEAREAKIQGSVMLKIYIDKDGRISQAEILAPLGYGLDLAALEAVANWEFRPAMQRGEPVGTWAQVQINFRLL